ncbi:MerR family transcriptional regulator [Accumulibacter sp.]|uniref:MerR family transcriptional regulator n=1 Tax=Accumulibacter sp. TaxID=2053492 RepID=UPI0025D81B3E|nr:MerR family transcriptional regulator [Accumulibacter sp.]MCM8594174.1 MerR family transcriptional regulator [Accumulibacter sp.]MCM8625736.1 MerR family transcriptional regulator [Accumulibacter sp.]MDS4048317.1 MerR family transcriptional regulator [Accumulibacter sp.]
MSIYDFVQDKLSPQPAMSISAVERETGLGKDTLRVWERRYGFPKPERDGRGERWYPAEQVDRLRLLKRLIDCGHRPGKLLAASEEELDRLSDGRRPETPAGIDEGDDVAEQVIRQIRNHDLPGLRQILRQSLMRLGIERFVIEVAAPLNQAVGEAWTNGELKVFEEHLYTEEMKGLLRQAIASLPAAVNRPRVLLTTVPDEPHLLGLLMVEALLTLDGVPCVPLGAETPLVDIRMAALAHHADAVALSFSLAFPGRRIAALIRCLRDLLPPQVELWIGGAGSRWASKVDNVHVLPSLPLALLAVREWRERHAAQD